MSNELIYNFQTDNVAYESIDLKGEKKYYVTGYISTPHLDLLNDIVTDDCMDDMVAQLKNKSIMLDLDHEAWRDNPNILPAGKIVEAKHDKNGIFAKAELNQFSPKFQNVWGSLKSGMLNSFSIAYKPIQKADKIVGGVKARLLKKVNLLNVALTGNPVNTNCNIADVFTKSLNEYVEVKMAEEEKTPETPEETPKEETPEEETKEEATEEVPKEEATEEAKTEEEAPAEEVEETKDATEEIDKKSFDAMSKELAELKAWKVEMEKMLDEPQFKALQEKPLEVEEKNLSPLERIR